MNCSQQVRTGVFRCHRHALAALAALALAGAAGASAGVPVEVRSAFADTPSARRAVTLDGSARTVGAVLEFLAEKTGLPLRAAPEVAESAVVTAGEDVPALHFLEGLARATHGRWRRESGEYRLLPGRGVPSAVLPLRRPVRLGREAALRAPLIWPPVLPERSNPPGSAPPPYGARHFGGALHAVARSCGVALIAHGPALTKPFPVPAGAPPGPAAVLELVVQRTGGEWQQFGTPLVLVRPAEDVVLERLSFERRSAEVSNAAAALDASLTPRQRAVLRAGGALAYAELSPGQQRAFAAAARAHLVTAPTYDRSLVADSRGWHLRGDRTGFHLHLSPAVNIVERPWPGVTPAGHEHRP